MVHFEPAEESSYRRLRADYDAAFARLRAEESWLRLIAQDPSPDRATRDNARRRIGGALRIYRENRDRLAGFLSSVPPVGRAGTLAGHAAAVQTLAHRLWGEAGLPIGDPEQH